MVIGSSYARQTFATGRAAPLGSAAAATRPVARPPPPRARAAHGPRARPRLAAGAAAAAAACGRGLSRRSPAGRLHSLRTAPDEREPLRAACKERTAPPVAARLGVQQRLRDRLRGRVLGGGV